MRLIDEERRGEKGGGEEFGEGRWGWEKKENLEEGGRDEQWIGGGEK